jgi:hypothetical protein
MAFGVVWRTAPKYDLPSGTRDLFAPMPSARTTVALLALLLFLPARVPGQWLGHGNDPQHTAISSVASNPLSTIRWSMSVDENSPSEPIFIHYGSPIATTANTIIMPVRTVDETYRIRAISGSSGSMLWEAATDFRTAPSDGSWVPSVSPTLTPSGALYYPGAGGTVYRVENPNAPSISPVRMSFLPDYAANQAAYDSSVYISTPLTSDSAGNLYFGYEVSGAAPGGFTSGIARIAPDGTSTYTSADLASGTGGTGNFRVGTNSAPALSLDDSKLYLALKSSTQAPLLAIVDSTTLAPQQRITLDGTVSDAGTSSPTIAPDGDVYFGTLGGTGSYHFRGKLHHFSGDLSQTFTAGSFGWDETVSIVPASMVPSYTGTSSYLIFSKYNDYKQAGGNGVNQLAILDPFAFEFDPLANADRMKEVLTIDGVTPDGPPDGAVREWCINTAAVDPITHSILVNSEDGRLYRWDLWTNTFTESVELVSTGVLEAYTPTMIGPDGAVYAINRSTLFSVVPEPTSAALSALGALVVALRRRRAH